MLLLFYKQLFLLWKEFVDIACVILALWYLSQNATYFFFPCIFISWRLIALQYCSGFCHTYIDMNQPWIYRCSPSRSPLPPPSPPHPSGSSPCTIPEHLSHASSLGWWSVSPLIVYLFQCCSLWTSHPRLLPQSLKVCSVHICLFFCFEYRVIVISHRIPLKLEKTKLSLCFYRY